MNLARFIYRLSKSLVGKPTVNDDGQARAQSVAVAQALLDSRIEGIEIGDDLADSLTRHGQDALAAGQVAQ